MTNVFTFAFAYLSKRTMLSAPTGTQYFRMNGQMDTESEPDQGDTHMENERMEQPVMTTSAVRPAQWPATDAASVAAERRRTARRQQRREEQIATGERHHRSFGGNASNRAKARINDFFINYYF